MRLDETNTLPPIPCRYLIPIKSYRKKCILTLWRHHLTSNDLLTLAGTGGGGLMQSPSGFPRITREWFCRSSRNLVYLTIEQFYTLPQNFKSVPTMIFDLWPDSQGHVKRNLVSYRFNAWNLRTSVLEVSFFRVLGTRPAPQSTSNYPHPPRISYGLPVARMSPRIKFPFSRGLFDK